MLVITAQIAVLPGHLGVQARGGHINPPHLSGETLQTLTILVSLDERLTNAYGSLTLTNMSASPATVLDALGDSSRRSILEHLANGSVPVGVLADQLPLSRPAVSQHLRVLKEADLVVETTIGTRRLYRISPTGLSVVRGYLDRFWAATLDNFAWLATADAQRMEDEPDH